MQLLKLAAHLQDVGQNGSDYDSHRSDSEGSDGDPEKQVTLYLHMLILYFVLQIT